MTTKTSRRSRQSTPETTTNQDLTPAVDELAVPDAAKLREFREGLSVSRAVASTLSGLTASAVWRIENGKNASDEERSILWATLQRIDRDGLAEGIRPRRKVSGADTQLKTISALLDEALALKTLREVKAVIEQAQAAISQ